VSGLNFRKKSTQERLRSIYSEIDAKEAEILIDSLVEKYRKKIVSTPKHLTQEDVILITYGDQVIHPGEEPLATLDRFLQESIKDVINSVHILPFYPYSSDDGFSVIDYKDVSPRIGSWDDVERLSENFSLMFDGVINHISQYSYWFKSFLENEEKYKNFFVEVEEGVDLSKVVRPRALPLIHEYRDCDEKIRRVWTTFSKDQVDLNYANYKVMVAVLDVLLFYVLKGAKLIRLDAIAFLWKEIGTDCIHLPQTHEAIQLMREVIHKVAPEVVIITETNVPHKENVSYFGSGDDEAQMVYNFALPPLAAHTILSGDTTALIKWAKDLNLPSDKVCFFNFIASHDGCGVRPVADLLSEDELSNIIVNVEGNGGFVSYRSMADGTKAPYELNASYIDIISKNDEDIEIRAKKFMLIQALKLAMPGVPGVYFHSLVGSTSDRDGVRRTGVLRSINREKLNYDYLMQELNEEGSLRSIIFNEYKKLLSIRKEEDAFDPYGEFEVLDAEDGLFVLLRKSKSDNFDILSINNFTDMPISYKLPSFIKDGAICLINEKEVVGVNVEVAPYETLWIKYKKGKR
jgi:sucrose phosphorylase